MTVAVLSAAESERFFALPLESEGVQAIWLKVENLNGYGLYIVPRSTDPQYYSAYETAFMNHRLFASKTNTEMDEFFQQSRIHLNVAAHATNTGFLFTNRSEGAKFVNIEMVHDMGAIRDGFFFQLPNGSFDYEKTKPSFTPESVRDLTLAELRHVIETLPCCTTDELGSNHGDPMNFVIIGSEDDVLGALTRQGWDPTHVLAIGTAWRTIGAFLSGDTYLHSPVSSLYFFGRQQDIAMQKARSTIHRRNHLRLWRVPYTYLGRAVWIGQISRDIGVHFTVNARFFVTHKIDPDVDSERSYLVQDLIASDYLYALAYAKGAVKASQEHPAANLTGDPYFSDGLRAVMLLSSKPVPDDHIDLLQWEMPAD
ncbi:MAG: LssY C-terminal domain-containing protein [Candidatus Binataceae bacterium]|nr:LssY C-terminal domain-containing protein [Candidatus Binataceae bacterium]